MSKRTLGLVLVWVFLASLPLWPQAGGTAALTGTVTDPTAAVVPGAQVTATHKATGVARTAATDSAGRYLITQLAPGTYNIEVTMSGFKTAVREDVNALVGVTTTVNVRLEVGAVAEEVLVEAGAAALNTTDASLGIPFSGTEVQSLPNLDLDPAGLLSLQPGVTFVPGSQTSPGGYSGIADEDARSGSVNGSRSDQTNITLDGVDVNDPQFGYAFSSVLRATQASLAEFRTTTTNYNADAGRSSAAQVQLVTKSGTNNVHGEVYWAHRNEAFNANDFFLNRAGQEEPLFRRHIYGVALGGPVVKDRFFLFGNFERLKENIFASAERNVPSLAMRDGVFFYPCAGGTAACPGNAGIGRSGASYMSQPGYYALSRSEVALLDPLGIGASDAILDEFQQFPDPNATGSFDNLNIRGFRFGAPVNNDYKTFILRADFNIDRQGKHTIFWRGTLQDDVIGDAPQFPGLEPNQTVLGASKGFSLGYTAAISPTVVNNFRWGLTRLKNQFAALRNQEFVDFRFIDDLRGYESGGTYYDSSGRTIPQHHIRDDLSWTRGRHTVSFGGEARWTRNTRYSTANSFHVFVDNPSWLPFGGRTLVPGSSSCAQPACSTLPAADASSRANDGLAELIGVISNPTAYYNYDRTGATLPAGEPVRRKFGVDEYEFYVQDQWRATPTLTFTVGVRYFISSPPWELDGNEVTPQPSLQGWFDQRRQLMLQGRPTSIAGDLTFDLAGKANGRPGYYAWDKNNWSPRLALAWAPRFQEGPLGTLFGDGKTAIRAGYSLVYDRMGNGLATTFDEGGSFGMSTVLDAEFGGCDTGGDPSSPDCARFTGPFDTAAAAAVSLPPPPAVSGFPATPPEDLVLIALSLNDSIVTPYSHTYNVSISRELPGDMTLEAAYVGRSGRNLLMIQDMAMPANLVDPASGVDAFQAARDLIAAAEQGLTPATIQPMAFWEDIFPAFGPTGINGGCLPADVFGVDPGAACGFSATAVALDYMMFYHGLPSTGEGFGAVTFWLDADFGYPAYPTCANGSDLDGDGFNDCPWTFFPAQYGDLQAWSSIARSEYHALQMTLRKRMSHGVLFNVNYTLSHSLDHASAPERANGYAPAGSTLNAGYSGSTVNSWDLSQEYGNSDYDMRHQFNANWVIELPYGRGRAFGSDAPGWANQVLGGWEVSGIFRANSGLPVAPLNSRTWPTNWDLQGNATCAPAGSDVFGTQTGPCPATQNVKNATGDRGPNIFADPDAAWSQFRYTLPGIRGPRNVLRADKYIDLDFGVAKKFNMPWEGHQLQFRWDVFNLLNSVYFDAFTMNLNYGDQGSFGDYVDVLGGPRRMQVTLRYTF